MDARTRYVFLSSGAVYASDRQNPYAMAKRAAEDRHRHRPDRSILDLRVFAYADAALPRDGHFFLCELARSIATRAPLQTSAVDMVRDYAGRAEVAALIRCWEAAGAHNGPLDVYTRAPARKSDILRIAHERFGVEIEYRSDVTHSQTGDKPVYASTDRAAAALGYDPQRTALEVVTAYLEGIAGSAAPAGV